MHSNTTNSLVGVVLVHFQFIRNCFVCCWFDQLLYAIILCSCFATKQFYFFFLLFFSSFSFFHNHKSWTSDDGGMAPSDSWIMTSADTAMKRNYCDLDFYSFSSSLRSLCIDSLSACVVCHLCLPFYISLDGTGKWIRRRKRRCSFNMCTG